MKMLRETLLLTWPLCTLKSQRPACSTSNLFDASATRLRSRILSLSLCIRPCLHVRGRICNLRRIVWSAESRRSLRYARAINGPRSKLDCKHQVPLLGSADSFARLLQASAQVEDLQKNLIEEQKIVAEKKEKTGALIEAIGKEKVMVCSLLGSTSAAAVPLIPCS